MLPGRRTSECLLRQHSHPDRLAGGGVVCVAEAIHLVTCDAEVVHFGDEQDEQDGEACHSSHGGTAVETLRWHNASQDAPVHAKRVVRPFLVVLVAAINAFPA